MYHKKTDKATNMRTISSAAKNERLELARLMTQPQDFTIRKINPDNGNECFDISIQSGTTILITEIKCRYHSSDKYPTTIIETKKIENMNAQIKEWHKQYPLESFKPYILVFFDNNSVYGWEVKGTELKGQIMAKQTSVRFGSGEYKLKDVTYFKISEGKKLR